MAVAASSAALASATAAGVTCLRPQRHIGPDRQGNPRVCLGWRSIWGPTLRLATSTNTPLDYRCSTVAGNTDGIDIQRDNHANANIGHISNSITRSNSKSSGRRAGVVPVQQRLQSLRGEVLEVGRAVGVHVGTVALTGLRGGGLHALSLRSEVAARYKGIQGGWRRSQVGCEQHALRPLHSCGVLPDARTQTLRRTQARWHPCVRGVCEERTTQVRDPPRRPSPLSHLP